MTIPELLRQWAEATPNAPALLAPGRQPLTYARLYDLTQALARQLRSLGVRPDDRVAIVAQNGPELAVSFLAVASTAVAAPLNPAYRVSELDFYLADLGAKAIIMDEPPSATLRLLLRHRVVRLLELERSASGEAGALSLSAGGRGRGKDGGLWSDGAHAPHLRDDGAAEARVAHAQAPVPVRGEHRTLARADRRRPLPERHAPVPHPRPRRSPAVVALRRIEHRVRARLPRAVLPRLALGARADVVHGGARDAPGRDRS